MTRSEKCEKTLVLTGRDIEVTDHQHDHSHGGQSLPDRRPDAVFGACRDRPCDDGRRLGQCADAARAGTVKFELLLRRRR